MVTVGEDMAKVIHSSDCVVKRRIACQALLRSLVGASAADAPLGTLESKMNSLDCLCG
jgi:hypothetical protein